MRRADRTLPGPSFVDSGCVLPATRPRGARRDSRTLRGSFPWRAAGPVDEPAHLSVDARNRWLQRLVSGDADGLADRKGLAGCPQLEDDAHLVQRDVGHEGPTVTVRRDQVIGICFWGARDDPAAARGATPANLARPPQASPRSAIQAAPPGPGRVSGGPEAAVKRKEGMTAIGPGSARDGPRGQRRRGRPPSE